MKQERATIGVGLVGAGFLAATRARCYAKAGGARLAAVASREGTSARKFAETYGVAHVAASVEELCARDDVEVVDLCVPNDLHRPFAELAASAGKHVVCTKPLTAYVGQDLATDAPEADVAARDRRTMLAVASADAEAMVRACEEAGVHLCYGENWVYAPAIVRARELLAASGGRALELRGWESHCGSHSPYAKRWRHTGGGALLRLGAHPVGAMLHLKREEGRRSGGEPVRPVAVTAEVADLTRDLDLPPEKVAVATGWVDVENWGCAIVHFSDGARGIAYGSDNLLGGMESKLELLASNCHLKCNLSPNDMVRAYAPGENVFGDEYLMEKTSTTAGWNSAIPDEDWSSGQQAMLAAFLEDVRNGTSPESDGRLGLDVTRVLYAAYVSAAEGRRVELGT